MFKARGGKTISKYCFLIKLPKGTKAISLPRIACFFNLFLLKAAPSAHMVSSRICQDFSDSKVTAFQLLQFVNILHGMLELLKDICNFLLLFSKWCFFPPCNICISCFFRLILLFLYFNESSLKTIQNSEEKDEARLPRTTPNPQIRPSMIFGYPNCISIFVKLLKYKIWSLQCNQSIKDLLTM